MLDDYYSRKKTINSDGVVAFANQHDRENEREVSKLIEQRWDCEVKPFGQLCAIDFYVLRRGSLIALMELKSRTHSSDKYETVFLNVRKWLALTMGEIGLGVPSIYIVKFTDKTMFIPIKEINAGRNIIGGTKRIVKSHTDIEPVIEVEVKTMRCLNERES